MTSHLYANDVSNLINRKNDEVIFIYWAYLSLNLRWSCIFLVLNCSISLSRLSLSSRVLTHGLRRIMRDSQAQFTVSRAGKGYIERDIVASRNFFASCCTSSSNCFKRTRTDDDNRAYVSDDFNSTLRLFNKSRMSFSNFSASSYSTSLQYRM